jgi:hypothetical protein
MSTIIITIMGTAMITKIATMTIATANMSTTSIMITPTTMRTTTM